MGKFLGTIWIFIFFLLLQLEPSVSKKKPKPSGGGSHRQPGYPQQNPPYRPNSPQGGYPQHYPGSYGGGYAGGYGGYGSQYSKPWKPKPPKPKMKHVAAAAVAGAAAGAVGGILLGRAMSNMRFDFNNPYEAQWWHENRNRYSDQVYYRNYDQNVSRDVFVRDCTEVTVNEYIEPTGNKTADEVERKVVKQVVHQMCTEQYRVMSGVGSLLVSPPVLLIITLVLGFLVH